MKKFNEFPAVQEYTHKDKKAVVKYIELLYSKDSDLLKIENLDDRKQKACDKAGLKAEDHPNLINLVKDTNESHLVFLYLSYHQHNSKFHNLIAQEQLLWRINRMIMEADDKSMDQALRLAKESESVIERVDKLRSEIYGTKEEVRVIAEAEMRKVIEMPTLEQRLKKASSDV